MYNPVFKTRLQANLSVLDDNYKGYHSRRDAFRYYAWGCARIRVARRGRRARQPRYSIIGTRVVYGYLHTVAGVTTHARREKMEIFTGAVSRIRAAGTRLVQTATQKR
jgi:hypothetical protein